MSVGTQTMTQCPNSQSSIAPCDQTSPELIADPELHTELRQLELTQSAIKFVDSKTEECPVCGAPWPPGHLETHLTEKIAAGKRAEAMRKRIMDAAEAIKKPAQYLRAQVNSLIEDLGKVQIGVAENDVEILETWRTDLDGLIGGLDNPLQTLDEKRFSLRNRAATLCTEIIDWHP